MCAFVLQLSRACLRGSQRAYIAWLLLGLISHSAHSDEIVRTPSETKAAFLKYIGDYTTWPAEWLQAHPSEHFVVGLVGSDPNGVIDFIERRNQGANKLLVNKRAVQLIRFDDMGNRAVIRNSIDELEKCSMLFLSQDSERAWSELKPFLEGKPIMTISELENFAISGGMVELEFDPEAQRVFMLFNMQALKEAGLVVNALLLDLDISIPIYPGE
jgi:hypothetical protein